MSKQKLEFTWNGRDKKPKLEQCILLEDSDKSYYVRSRVKGNDILDNQLILGNNLHASNAFEQELSGQIKCICIDPPFNTDDTFENYDDSLELSICLELMHRGF